MAPHRPCVGRFTESALSIDDILVAEDAQGKPGDSTGVLYIGAGNTLAPGIFFSGMIDDVRIYNRVVSP